MPTAPPTLRIGLLVPSSNTVMEPDFYRHLPPGWTVHTARMYMEDTTVEGESRMLDEFALPAARDLATARPHIAVFGCTSAGALRGNEYEARLIQEIGALTHAPVVSVIKAARAALRGAGVKSLVVATPYVEALNTRIRASLEDDGLHVLCIDGLDISENFEIAQVPDVEIVRLARRAVGGLKPDALFISCTNFPAMSALPELRAMFPFPVYTSNQIVLEAALAAVNVSRVPATAAD